MWELDPKQILDGVIDFSQTKEQRTKMHHCDQLTPSLGTSQE